MTVNRLFAAWVFCCSFILTAFPYGGPVTDRQTAAAPNAAGIAEGTPSISLTYVPPYGAASATLFGQVLHANTSTNSVVVYISVDGGATWWVKPNINMSVTRIGSDGTWSAVINTGGIDPQATKIAAFLVPNTYSPPVALEHFHK